MRKAVDFWRGNGIGQGMGIGVNIEKDTRALALPAGRRVGQAGHAVARAYLSRRMAEIGLQAFAGGALELPFSVAGGGEFTNLVGVLRGGGSGLDPVLIGAHYDSAIDAPSADANATGLATVLAAAEHFAESGLKRDLIVAFFDSAEAPFFATPAMGSTRFYEDHCGGIDFACVLILDLIGHDVEIEHPAAAMMPALKRLLFVFGAESDAALPGVVEWAAGEAKGLKVLATLNRYPGDRSDHHAFRLGGQRFLFLTCGEGSQYHLPGDDPEWVNFEKVRHVFALLVDLVTRIDTAEMSGEGCDPVEFEVRMLKRVIGMAYSMVLKMVGVPPLQGREDIDVVAARLVERLAGGDEPGR